MRARYLPFVMDPLLIALYRSMEPVFDPPNILNSAKISAPAFGSCQHPGAGETYRNVEQRA
jgi:hypothetical protein